MAEQPDPTPEASGILSSSSTFSGAPYNAPFAGSSTEVCGLCSRHIGGDYFRVNGMMACPQCAEQARHGQPADSHAAFTRGVLLGVGAAIVGLAVYATITILTGWSIGYVALGVGWLVAKAIKKGSNGLGGRRYQIAAVLLTYAAISMAAVPIGISFAVKHHKAAQQQAAGRSADFSRPGATDPVAFPALSPAPVPKPAAHWGPIAGQLALLGLASPFMELRAGGVNGLLGLFILFIGLRIAWRSTASSPLSVDGPFAPLTPGATATKG